MASSTRIVFRTNGSGMSTVSRDRRWRGNPRPPRRCGSRKTPEGPLHRRGLRRPAARIHPPQNREHGAGSASEVESVAPGIDSDPDGWPLTPANGETPPAEYVSEATEGPSLGFSNFRRCKYRDDRQGPRETLPWLLLCEPPRGQQSPRRGRRRLSRLQPAA